MRQRKRSKYKVHHCCQIITSVADYSFTGCLFIDPTLLWNTVFRVERKHNFLFTFLSHRSKFTLQGANLGTSRHSAFLGSCQGNHISRQQWQSLRLVPATLTPFFCLLVLQATPGRWMCNEFAKTSSEWTLQGLYLQWRQEQEVHSKAQPVVSISDLQEKCQVL